MSDACSPEGLLCLVLPTPYLPHINEIVPVCPTKLSIALRANLIPGQPMAAPWESPTQPAFFHWVIYYGTIFRAFQKKKLESKVCFKVGYLYSSQSWGIPERRELEWDQGLRCWGGGASVGSLVGVFWPLSHFA